MRPILVIQMQRMGDLILSYPLFLWLERVYPGHPIWVMAEPTFAVPLARLSPHVRYLDFAHSGEVLREKFHLVINLSHRTRSMELAGRLQCESLVGGYIRDGVTRIAGVWQEYRTSLTHNNRHNRFHWADLNALDVIPPQVMSETRWPMPRVMPESLRKVGLFLGASEAEKRPTAAFWAELVGELERRGHIPVLLGGPGERSCAVKCGGLPPGLWPAPAVPWAGPVRHVRAGPRGPDHPRYRPHALGGLVGPAGSQSVHGAGACL
jgi:ADP-heptose:LPS heptosyltransferase